MSEPGPRTLEYQDLLAATDPDGPTVELLDGELVWQALPRPRHGVAQKRMARQLPEPDEEDGGDGWWILTEPDVGLPSGDVVRPDMAGWRFSRLPELPEGKIEVVPDWIAEIVSLGHADADTVRKRRLYRKNGVGWYWLVFPEDRTIEVLELVGRFWVQRADLSATDVAIIPPFLDRTLAVEKLFAPVRPAVK